jgi:hypothetical protein
VPLTPEDLAPYRPRHPGFDFRLEPADDKGESHESFRFRFTAFSEMERDLKTVEGTFYRSRKVPSGHPSPLVLCSPILAGAAGDYLECRVFSRWACARGLSTFYVHQEEDILAGWRDGVEFERLFRENIQDNLRALDLFVARPDIDPERLGTLGISLGGIKNVVLIAVEPRFRGNVLCLAGADLPAILGRSEERRVLRYVRARMEREGLTREEVVADLRANVLSEPARFAESVASDRVLLFLGSLDDKVPYDTGLLLREKLGEPETYIIPVGHYTAILVAPYAARRAFAFLRRSFGLPSAVRPASG